MLALTDAELDDDDSGVDDQGEHTDDREPELYDGGGGMGAMLRWNTTMLTA